MWTQVKERNNENCGLKIIVLVLWFQIADWIVDWRLRDVEWGLRIENWGLSIADCCSRIVDHGLLITNWEYESWITDSGFRIVSGELCIEECELRFLELWIKDSIFTIQKSRIISAPVNSLYSAYLRFIIFLYLSQYVVVKTLYLHELSDEEGRLRKYVTVSYICQDFTDLGWQGGKH